MFFFLFSATSIRCSSIDGNSTTVVFSGVQHSKHKPYRQGKVYNYIWYFSYILTTVSHHNIYLKGFCYRQSFCMSSTPYLTQLCLNILLFLLLSISGQKIHTTLDLNMFFNRPCEYYTYHGSLTTPPCLETVQWIIFKNPIMVTDDAVSIQSVLL